MVEDLLEPDSVEQKLNFSIGILTGIGYNLWDTLEEKENLSISESAGYGLSAGLVGDGIGETFKHLGMWNEDTMSPETYGTTAVGFAIGYQGIELAKYGASNAEELVKEYRKKIE